MRTSLVLLLLLLLTGGCSSASHPVSTRGPAPAATTVTPTTTPATTRTAAPTPAVVVTTATTPQGFRTVDGDLGCDVEPAYARCDVRRHTWPLPPQPADCHSGWGHGIEMQAGTLASFFCGSDSVLGSARVLAPGHGLRVGFVECDALTDATVRCKGTADAHGFVVSRTRYSLS